MVVTGVGSRLRRLWGNAWGAGLDSAYATGRELHHALHPGNPDAYATGHLAPVILIPGVYETWEFLQPLAERLHELGHPIHVVPGFGYNRDSIPAMALLVARYLEVNELTGVVIVAHSKGGLIGKQLLVTDEVGERIDQVVAVNTPFAGSSLARYTRQPALQEFMPSGAALSALAKQSDANSRIVSIYSANDPLIPGGSALVGATNVRLPLIGHFRVLSSPLLLRAVENAVGH